MLVVPVKGDRIKTTDDSVVRTVSSYTSLKDEPAVYLTASSDELAGDNFVFFDKIVEINGVRVEYDDSSKMFKAMGPLKRRYHLPQAKDKIKIKLMDVDFKDDVEDMTVTGLRLHSKRYGPGRGLLVITQEGQFSLKELLDIDAALGKFDVRRFQRYYFDYLPYEKPKR